MAAKVRPVVFADDTGHGHGGATNGKGGPGQGTTYEGDEGIGAASK